MLEIPEAQTIARQLKERVIGKKMVRVIQGQSPHGFAWYGGDEAYTKALLEGKRIADAYAFSGYVELAMEDVRLAFHDGINLRYLPVGAALPKKHQLYLEFSEGDGLVCTVQMYGGMHAFFAGTNQNAYYQTAREKNSPLEPAFDSAYFRSLAEEAKPTLSIKGLLATEQRIPGLGNGCLQDILLLSGLHPRRKVSSCSQEELDRLFGQIKQTLTRMTEGGGRDTEKDLYGTAGGYPTLLSARTWQFPCPLCGGILERKAFLGGNVYTCGHCQPL